MHQRQPEGQEHIADSQAARFPRISTVVRFTGLARSTICRPMAEDKFPSPVHLAMRAVAWRRPDRRVGERVQPCVLRYFAFATFRAVFFAATFAGVFAAGLRVVLFAATLAGALPAGGALEARFTACFTALFTAATAPFTVPFTDLTASFAAFLTFFSMGPWAASFSALDFWRRSAA